MNNNLSISYENINKFHYAEYNPRKASNKEFNDVKTSLERFGFVEPIVVNSAKDRQNIIIGGHLRVKVAKKMGIRNIPVVYIEIGDIEREKELNIRLNKNTGSFDYDLLKEYDKDFLIDVGKNDYL